MKTTQAVADSVAISGAAGRRIQSVDLARGIVMILMALDHVRDFFHAPAMIQSPTDMATTTVGTFLARWVTHFCAPMFLLLAGVSARLWLGRTGRTKPQLSRFLFYRGLWLIFLELTAMRLAFDFTFRRQAPILLITLWALGMSMIVLAGLIHLPVRVVAIFSATVIGLQDLFDGVPAARFGSYAWAWNILHQPGGFVTHGVVVVVGYPLLPLIGTMAFGYCLGSFFLRSEVDRRRVFLQLGIAMSVAFVVLRAINIYGDPSRWSPQTSAVMTVLSFLNTTKYPASLDFLLMTIGPALLLLASLDRISVKGWNPVLVFGRVPLFYFIVHLFWIHILLVIFTFLRYGQTSFLFVTPPSMGGPPGVFPKDFGYSLSVVLWVWAFVVITMYPLCKWFASIRARGKSPWLAYL